MESPIQPTVPAQPVQPIAQPIAAQNTYVPLVEKTTSKKLPLLTVIFLLILVGAIAIIAFFLFSKDTRKTDSNIVSAPVISIPVSGPVVSDDGSTTKYTSTLLGYEVTYPNTWVFSNENEILTLKATLDDVSVSIKIDTSRKFNENFTTWTQQKTSLIQMAQGNGAFATLTTINGISMVKTQIAPGGLGDRSIINYLFEDVNKPGYYFTVTTIDPSLSHQEDILEVLSTFKFI